jgi:hypothetical protein
MEIAAMHLEVVVGVKIKLPYSPTANTAKRAIEEKDTEITLTVNTEADTDGVRIKDLYSLTERAKEEKDTVITRIVLNEVEVDGAKTKDRPLVIEKKAKMAIAEAIASHLLTLFLLTVFILIFILAPAVRKKLELTLRSATLVDASPHLSSADAISPKTGSNPFGEAAPRDQLDIERKIDARRLERESAEKGDGDQVKIAKAEMGTWHRKGDKAHLPNLDAFGGKKDVGKDNNMRILEPKEAKDIKSTWVAKPKQSKKTSPVKKNLPVTVAVTDSKSNVRVDNPFALLDQENA